MTRALATVPRETTRDGMFALIPVELIDLATNVRSDLGDLDELAASIQTHGILQPLVVHRDGARFVLDIGHRRLAAAKAVGMPDVPAVVSAVPSVGGARAIEQLVENLQRADLNDVDEARALREILDADPDLTQAALAQQLGRSAPWVSNTLVVLEAAPAVQEFVAAGRLNGSHVKALRGLAPKTQAELAKRAVDQGASAHAVEEMVQAHKRNAEWKKEQETAGARRADEAKEHIAAGVERVAKRIPKDAAVYLSTWYNAPLVELLAKALAAAGYVDVHKREGGRLPGFVGHRKESADCDCTAWTLEIGSEGGVVIHEACVVAAHAEAKRAADHRAYLHRDDLQKRVKDRLAEVLVEDLADLPPRAARIALWIVLGWQMEDWTKAQDALLVNTLDEGKPKRKKRDPWATLSETPDAALPREVAAALSKALRDGNFKVDWERLATELGVAEAAEA